MIDEQKNDKTERLHLHGIVWGIGTDKLITNKWNYGITFTGVRQKKKMLPNRKILETYQTKWEEEHQAKINGRS